MSNKHLDWVLNGLIIVMLIAAWIADTFAAFTIPMIIVALVITIISGIIGFCAQFRQN